MPATPRRRSSASVAWAALAMVALFARPGPALADEPAPDGGVPEGGADPVSAAEGVEADEAIELATRTPLTTRDAPGIISVVDREEIERSGARDLLDILHLVPGFSFGVDNAGVVSVGFRGLWGQEGKVLFLLDGQELNETLYSTMQLGLHVAAGVIERVEVIRGPGSVIHGGFAELAVVNVVTRDARSLDGAAASLSLGALPSSFGHVAGTASHAGRYPSVPGLTTALHLAWMEGKRSDRRYTDLAGGSYEMAGDSRLGNLLVDLGIGYRGLKLRLVYDDYRVDTRDGIGAVLETTARQRWEGIYTDVRYEARLGKVAKLTPYLTWKQQTPWQVTDASSPLYYDKTARRLQGGLVLSLSPHESVDILVGAAGQWDHGALNSDNITGLQTRFGEALTLDYGTAVGYAQLVFRNLIANLTAGARYEWNSRFGSSFVPRVGLTRIAGRINAKLLYSRAFRAPGIENLNLASSPIRPEFIDVVEAELGLQLTGHLALSANGYFMRLSDTIVYSVTDAGEGYANAGRTGAAGAEAQLRMRYAWGFANLAWSFAHTAGQNAIPTFAIADDGSRLLGMPSHKVVLSSGWNVWPERLSFGFTVVVLSPRRGFTGSDEMGNPVLGDEPWTSLVGLSATFRNLGARGLDLSAGASNLLNETYRVMQPYDAGHAPLPMAGREVWLRIAYSPPRAP